MTPVAARGMVSLFRASEGTLAMKMVTLASTVLLLQEIKILPNKMYCGKCEELIPDTFKQRLTELPPAGPCCQLCSLRYHSEENIAQTKLVKLTNQFNLYLLNHQCLSCLPLR